MKISRFLSTARALAVLSITAGALATVSVTGVAQSVPPPASTAAANSTQDEFLSLAEISARVSAQGIRVTELEIRDRIVEVEGRDGSNREVELIVDRRSGQILSRELDD